MNYSDHIGSWINRNLDHINQEDPNNFFNDPVTEMDFITQFGLPNWSIICTYFHVHKNINLSYALQCKALEQNKKFLPHYHEELSQDEFSNLLIKTLETGVSDTLIIPRYKDLIPYKVLEYMVSNSNDASILLSLHDYLKLLPDKNLQYLACKNNPDEIWGIIHLGIIPSVKVIDVVVPIIGVHSIINTLLQKYSWMKIKRWQVKRLEKKLWTKYPK